MLGYVLQEIAFHVGDDLFKTFPELVEILFVEENLVFVEGKAAVSFLPSFAFCDGQIVIVVTFCCLNIKKISSFSRADRFLPHVIRIAVGIEGPLVFVFIHRRYKFVIIQM